MSWKKRALNVPAGWVLSLKVTDSPLTMLKVSKGTFLWPEKCEDRILLLARKARAKGIYAMKYVLAVKP